MVKGTETTTCHLSKAKRKERKLNLQSDAASELVVMLDGLPLMGLQSDLTTASFHRNRSHGERV